MKSTVRAGFGFSGLPEDRGSPRHKIFIEKRKLQHE